MTLLLIVTGLWVAALLVLVALVRRHPVTRWRCQWCGDAFYEPAECDAHETHCPGNPANRPPWDKKGTSK